jgi:thioredoxin-related protein
VSGDTIKSKAIIFLRKLQQQYLLNFLVVSVVLFCTSLVFGPDAMSDIPRHEVTEASDLSKDASLARDQGLVILLEFASESCEYCRLLEEEFLKPMLIDQEYRNKVIIRTVRFDGYKSFKGFKGESTSPDQFASRYNIQVTPTMVFLDANGDELSEKLVGIWSIDFFGGYIDQRIDSAKRKIH